MPLPNRNQSLFMRKPRGSTRAAVARTLPPYRSNVQISRKFRWSLRGLDTDALSEQYSLNVTANSLAQAISVIRDDTANPIVTASLFNAVRLRSVRVYYTPPLVSATNLASVLPAEGGWTVSIEPYNTFTGTQIPLDEHTSTSTGSEQMAIANFSPDPRRYPNLTAWRPATDTEVLFILKAYPGAFVDITMDCMIPDASGNVAGSTTTTNGAAVNGAFGFGYLDAGVAAGSRSWQPVGAFLALS